MKVHFTGPWPFESGAWKAHVRATPATYRLRAWDRDTDSAVPISRASSVDHEGVLDIGTTSGGYGRLSTALRAMKTGKGSHAAGLKYFGYDFATAFPLKDIQVEVVHVPTEELAEAVELWLLEDYLWRYKDLPPLNSTAGNWKKVDRWLRSLGRTPRCDDLINLRGLLPPECASWPPFDPT